MRHTAESSPPVQPRGLNDCVTIFNNPEVKRRHQSGLIPTLKVFLAVSRLPPIGRQPSERLWDFSCNIMSLVTVMSLWGWTNYTVTPVGKTLALVTLCPHIHLVHLCPPAGMLDKLRWISPAQRYNILKEKFRTFKKVTNKGEKNYFKMCCSQGKQLRVTQSRLGKENIHLKKFIFFL